MTMHGYRQGESRASLPVPSRNPWQPREGLTWLGRAILRSEVLPISLLMVPFLALFLGSALLGGSVFLPADMVYLDALWKPYAPASCTGIANNLVSDLIYHTYPLRFHSREAMRQFGELPLWNPYIFAGQPFLANAQSGLFYPLNWLAHVVPLHRFFAWAGALRLYLASLLTYLFLRSNGAGKPASLLAGLTYGFCGPMVVWLGSPLPDVFLWLPGSLLAVHRAFASRRPVPWMTALALLLGVQGLAGHFQSYFHVLVVTAAYAALQLALSRRSWRLAGSVALAIGAGIALSAVQIIPFAEYLAESGTWLAGGRSSVGPGDRWWYSPEAGPNLASAVTLVLPDFYGNPATQDYYWPFETYQNYSEQSIYVGTVPLLLALVALLRPRKNERLFFLGLAVVAFSVALRLPLFEAVNHMPVFSAILNKRLRFVVVFALAVLAGWGANDLFGTVSGSDEARRLARLVGLGAGVLAVTVAGLLLGMQAVRLGILAPHSAGALQGPSAVWRWARVRTYLPALVGLAATTLLWLYARGWLSRLVLALAVLLLAGSELVFMGRGYCPTVPRDWLFPDTPALAYLRGLPQPIRVLESDGALLYNFGMVVGIPTVGGYDLPAPRRLSELYTRLGGKDIHRQRWHAEWPLLDICGIQYIVGTNDLPAERYELLYKDQVLVHRLREALPRVFSVRWVEMVASQDEALERLLATTFDRRQVALIEAAPAELSTLEYTPARDLQITRYEPNRVTVRGHFDGPGFVVLADAYDDDWQVTVNGENATVYPTDYLLRGVVVPAGDQCIEFVYAPVAYRLGKAVSLLAFVSVVLALAVGRDCELGPITAGHPA